MLRSNIPNQSPVLQTVHPEEKTTWQRLCDFFEHPLFVTAMAVIGTLGGFFYTPILALCGTAILFAFHRAGVVSNKSVRTQATAYAVLFAMTTFSLYGLNQVIKKNLPQIPTASEIAAKILGKLPPAQSQAQPPAAPIKVAEPKADIQVKFMEPKDVIFQLFNPSNEVANEPRYSFGLQDLDFPEDRKMQVLPIVSRLLVGDYLRPHDKYLPTDILSYQPEVRALVNPGDHIYGSMVVTCRNCIKSRVYWIYFVDGKGGWYSEAPQAIEEGKVYQIDMDKLRHDTDVFLNARVPIHLRQQIKKMKP